MTSPLLIIGIGYEKHVGKDTFARVLMNHQPFVHAFNPFKIGFADALKEEFAGIFDTTVEEIDKNKELWRRGLQFFGTEYVQEILGKKLYWVDRVKNRIPYLTANNHRALIITDVRFLHEAEFIKNNNGVLVKIVRGKNNTKEKDKHRSETELAAFAGWDYVIENNGSLNQLAFAAMEFIDNVMKSRT